MSSVITTDFERWKAQEAALGKPVALNEFVFANVPGLDPSKDISRDEKLPPSGQIVHRQAVNKAGLASENAVAYSVTLGTDVGDFVFNWIGLINKESGTLAMITHAPEQRKIKTIDGVQGNVLTRSFLLEFNGAATETQITTSAETWQIDFTARLAGMDEIQRLANRDIYGAAAFFGDGFLVTKAAEQYRVTPGAAYIEGLRGTLEEITTFNNLRDTKIYADFTFQGNLVSKWQTFVKVTTAKTLAHYQDAAGFQHYVAVIAEIDQNGNITDKRVKGTAIDRELAELKKDLPERYQPKGDYQPAGSYAKPGDSYTKVEANIKFQPLGNYADKNSYNPQNFSAPISSNEFRSISEGGSAAFFKDGAITYTKDGKEWKYVNYPEKSGVMAVVDDIPAQLTGQQLIELLKEVDGTGSGLDADFIRGLPADFTLVNNGTGGYQKLPSGLIIQWGISEITSGTVWVPFNIVFPSAVAHVSIHDNSGGETLSVWQINNLNVRGFSADLTAGISNPGKFGVPKEVRAPWFAFGF